MRKISIALAMAALGLAIAGTAQAHARLKTASPAVGSIVAAGPQDLRLQFSEPVDPGAATAALTAEDGKDLGRGELQGDATNPTTLILKLPAALGPGTYKVSWTVITEDKTKTQGSYSFRVGP
jgi:methionine-rich copper-binding protein CopC